MRHSRRRACRRFRTISPRSPASRWSIARSTAWKAARRRLSARSTARLSVLPPTKLSPPHGAGGVGGPIVPAGIDPGSPASDPALADAAHDVATAERLKALLAFMPVRMPLAGDPELTSPFGYRADPFLGRLMLHPGVDLAEPYGSEIHAAAAGRVVRAGPEGGYG